jgi:hypothetical protein
MSDAGSKIEVWSQKGFWSKVFATSVIDSEIIPHSAGHGDLPKVRRKATKRRPLKRVILSKLVELDKLHLR